MLIPLKCDSYAILFVIDLDLKSYSNDKAEIKNPEPTWSFSPLLWASTGESEYQNSNLAISP